MLSPPKHPLSRRAAPPTLAMLAFALLGLACGAERPAPSAARRSTPPADATLPGAEHLSPPPAAERPTATSISASPAAERSTATSISASPAAERPTASTASTPIATQLVALGERLFFDVRLSGNDTLSCASCHDPARAFSDGRRASVGVSGRPLRRNAPSLVNLAARAPYFWDGRAATLEEQALGPLSDPDEMGQDPQALEAELAADAGYRALFARSFSGEGVSVFNVARALAAFERTLVSRSSPYDRYLAGDASALDGAARRGLSLFEGKAECTTCHRGPELTDNQFHRIAFAGDDPGRAAVGPGPRGGFKTPSLREVARTAPYFHDGSAASLDEVVDHYARGGDARAGEARDIHPIELDEGERRDLVAFLRALSSGP